MRLSWHGVTILSLAAMSGGLAHASIITGLPACTTLYQLNCAQATAGGDTLLSYTPGHAIGVYGVLGGGQTVFLNSDGSSTVDAGIQALVGQADAVVAKYAPYDPLPSCGGTTVSYCLAPNPGGDAVVTNSTTASDINVYTPVSQRVDQYSTTVTAMLNGSQTVFQQTFAAASSDPTVLAAIALADSILAGDSASYGSPTVVTNPAILQGTQTVNVQTGPPVADGNTSTSTVDTFGPAVIYVLDNQNAVFTVISGQLDVNVNTANEYDVPFNAVTTSTYLTTASVTIAGTTTVSAAPEPGGVALLLVGLMTAIGFRRRQFMRL